MTDKHLTKPIHVGPHITLGETAGAAMPFEPANIDYSKINQRRMSDPTYGQNVVPDAIVNSCSQCCMETINGKPNLLGKLHKKIVKSCSQCPVGQASDHIQARDGSGNLMFRTYPDGTRRPMSQTEVMLMETDGTE